MAITKVQEVFSYLTSGGSVNKTFTIAAPAAGSSLFLFTQSVSGELIVGVSGGGVTWTQIAVITAASGASGELWAGANSSGSGTTITVTTTNVYSGRIDAGFSEYAGMPATLTADGGSNATTNNPNNVTPSVTPTAGTPTLLLAADLTYNHTVSAGPTGGFTALSTTGGSGYAYYAYQIVASASGAYQAGWTNSAGYSASRAGLYAFSGSGGGGTKAPPWPPRRATRFFRRAG